MSDAPREPTIWYVTAQSEEDPKHYYCCRRLDGQAPSILFHEDELILDILLGSKFFTVKRDQGGTKVAGREFVVTLRTAGSKSDPDSAARLPTWKMHDQELQRRPEPAMQAVASRASALAYQRSTS